MNLTRCNQGHFFDADKFTTCPHCTATSDQQGKTVPSAMAATPTPAASGASTPQAATVPSPMTPPGAASAVTPANKGQNNAGGSSFRSQVDDVQKTVGMFNVEKSAKQPVAGWVVCVEGPHLGEDFRIVMGRNFLGRAGNMDIVLAKDKMVSRDKHAIIVYEPKGNMFIIQAGESKELFYLNDKVVLSPTEIKPYDTIKIGSSKLLFVPFCSENFNWNDIKDEETEENE